MYLASRDHRRLSLDRRGATQSTRFIGEALLLLCGLLLSGCGSQHAAPPGELLPPAESAGQATSTRAEARRVLDGMLRQYRSAREYSDDAYVSLAYIQGGAQHADRAPLAVSFRRGEALRLRAYAVDAGLVDGRMRATIQDAATGNFGGQVLDVSVEQPFTLEDIYRDPTLTHFAVVGLGGPSPQLELLLAEEPLSGLFSSDADISLAEPQTVDGHTCDRLVILADGLRYVLWIRREDSLLRRVELPTAGTEMASDPSVRDIRLSIEIVDALLAVPPSEEWRPRETSDATHIRHFVLPPPKLAYQGLGAPPEPFRLATSDEELVITEAGSDRDLTVMMWIANHPASRMAAEALQAIADRWHRDHSESARFVLVMAEPQAAGASGTAEMLRTWNVGLPNIDDHQAVGRDVFGIREAPSLCVLGDGGAVEWFNPRVGPDMPHRLPMILEDLLEGKSVGLEVTEQYEKDQATYHRLLEEARG